MKLRELMDRYFRVCICGGCGEILPYEQISSAFCPRCLLRWRAAKTENCSECFQPAMTCSCMSKGLSASGMLTLRKSVFYRAEQRGEPQNRILYYLKHHPNRRMAHFLAEELLGALTEEVAVLGLQLSDEKNGEGDTNGEIAVGDSRKNFVLVGVPRSRGARSVEGFDQAELIADALSRMTGIDSVMAIKPKIGGKTQKKLNSAGRFRNMKNRFVLKDADAVRGKCVLLIDDIVTTGASMAACVKLLQQAGASSVIGLCVAQNRGGAKTRKTPKKGGRRKK